MAFANLEFVRRPSSKFVIAVTFALMGIACGGCGRLAFWQKAPKTAIPSSERLDILKRAQVWSPTNVSAMDLKTGPQAPGGFARGVTVRCDYVEADMSGRSPKFECNLPGKEPDHVKVKYGRENAEVYGEVMSTRLLWALGFGADRMYPVRVICHGCPLTIKEGTMLPSGDRLFDPAVIERKLPGREIKSKFVEGWSWRELDLVDPALGGAPIAHRDALKLLAVIIQHTDSKAPQQRLVCLDPAPPEGQPIDEASCDKPFMFMQDVGLTFGKTDVLYRKENYVNLYRWSSTRVWTGRTGCTGNLDKPFLGTLERPIISEEGRAFLAKLLNELRDQQLRDLFEASRVTLRPEPPGQEKRAGTRVEDWVAAFKQKRKEVNDRTCAPAAPAR